MEINELMPGFVSQVQPRTDFTDSRYAPASGAVRIAGKVPGSRVKPYSLTKEVRFARTRPIAGNQVASISYDPRGDKHAIRMDVFE